MIALHGKCIEPPAEMDLRARLPRRRRSTRSSTICETLFGISGVGQSE